MDDSCAADCFALAPACAAECLEPAPFPVINLLGSVVLVMLSAMFSGLTLGLLSLSLEGLDILISAGDERERGFARRIYPLRKSGNLLLCTLLLGNTLVNALIAILSASMTSGLVGGLISTLVIVTFGEIIPQSICNRHGLRIGAASVVIVWPLVILLLPFTWPIAKCLDCILGREMGTSYNKRQLDALLEMQVEGEGALTEDDKQMLAGALTFAEKQEPPSPIGAATPHAPRPTPPLPCTPACSPHPPRRHPSLPPVPPPPPRAAARARGHDSAVDPYPYPLTPMQVHTIMTPLSDIFSISITDVLHFDRLKVSYQCGHNPDP